MHHGNASDGPSPIVENKGRKVSMDFGDTIQMAWGGATGENTIHFMCGLVHLLTLKAFWSSKFWLPLCMFKTYFLNAKKWIGNLLFSFFSSMPTQNHVNFKKLFSRLKEIQSLSFLLQVIASSEVCVRLYFITFFPWILFPCS